MVEMYVGLLAGMIMLGLGGSSYTKDFAVKYLVYAFSVGMKLMGLVMIAKIGSDILLGLAEAPTASSEQFITTLAIAGIFRRCLRDCHVRAPDPAGRCPGRVGLGWDGSHPTRWAGHIICSRRRVPGRGGSEPGFPAANAARAGGSSLGGAAMRGMEAGFGGAAGAVGSAAKEKAIGSPGAYAGSLLGLANAKLDQKPGRAALPACANAPINDTK